jgi:hypothetical protein
LASITSVSMRYSISARDSVRTILQYASIRRSPSLWESPVSAKENSTTASVVYGHRRGIGTTFYVGATFGQARDADAGIRRDILEIFAKASWTFDLL